MKKILSFFLFVFIGSFAFAQTTVVINEVNADNPGGPDTREFIELYGTPNGSLSGYTLVFCGGSTLTYYYAIDLSAYSLDQFGFFVAGNALATNVDLVFANALLQNGPDAVALYFAPITSFPNGAAISSNNLVDAAVYGTGDAPIPALITALGLNAIPGYTQFDETVQASGTPDLTQSRIPDGGTALVNTSYVLQALTPGTWNSNPCAAGTPIFLDDVSPLTLCDNVATSVAMDAYNGGGNGTFVAVDASQNIVAVADVDFIFGGTLGTYTIHSIGYLGTLDPASIAFGAPLSGITASGCISTSTATLSVTLVACAGCSGGNITSDLPANGIVVTDGTPDLHNLFTTSISNTDTYVFALLDNNGNFLQWINSSFDFNDLTAGSYQIQGFSYEGNLTGDAAGAAFSAISADICFEASTNSISFIVIESPTVVINEVNSDNITTTDTQEFIELFGGANKSLTGLCVVLIDGTTLSTYNAFDLDNYSTDANGFFVLGEAIVSQVDYVFPGTTAVIQNGADAVAVYVGNANQFPNGSPISTTRLVDAIVYGTADLQNNSLIASLGLNIVAGYVQFDETAQTLGTDLTVSRIPDGGAPFSMSYVTQALTPGTWNLPPCTSGTPTLSDGTATATFCSNQPTVINFNGFNGTGNGLLLLTDATGIIIQELTSNTYNFNSVPGTYRIYSVGYTGTLNTASVQPGMNVLNVSASQCVSVSASFISVVVNLCLGCDAGVVSLSNGNTSVLVQLDTNADVLVFNTTSSSTTDTYLFALTDASNNFIQWLTAGADFNTLPAGQYYVQGVSYEGVFTAPVVGQPLSTATASNCVTYTTLGVSIRIAVVPNVVINEVNADNPGGADTKEFIELFGAPNTSLNGFSLVFCGGSSITNYYAMDLSAYSLNSEGFFVAGNALATNVNLVFPNATLQNGTDAVGLYFAPTSNFPSNSAVTSANLIDAVVYGTNDAPIPALVNALGLNSIAGYAQFDETAQVSGTDLTQSRVPDGGAPFVNTSYVLQALTPGTWNAPLCLAGTTTFEDGTTSVTLCTNALNLVSFTAFNGVGNSTHILTDGNGIIISEIAGLTYNFNALVGSYRIYTVAYTNTLNAASIAAGQPISGVSSDNCISIDNNFISITVVACFGCEAGLVGTANGSTNVSVLLNSSADVLGLTTTSTSATATYAFALTDLTQHFIQWVPASFDFNTLVDGIYLVYGVSYEGTFTEPAVGALISTATASNCVAWTPNFIYINALTVAEVVINELNADNPGGNDTQEFVELYGEANASLNNLVIVFYGGSTGGAYAAFDLDGYSTDANGFFVLGDTLTTNVNYMIPNATLQNGADGVALFVGNGTDFPNTTPPTTNNLLDVMIYGTDDAPATGLITGFGLDVMFPGYAQFNETAQAGGTDLTQSRIPDGGPALSNYNVVLQALTPGTFNVNVSVQEIEGFDQLVLFPNPTSNNFNLQWNSNSNELVQIRIVDITGKVVYQNSHVVSVGRNTIEMDAETWASGYYTIELKVNDRIGRMKLMKN